MSFSAEYVFGVPGTQVNPIADAVISKASLKFMRVRDEGVGAVMATVVARLTGRPGACLGMVAPSAVKLLNGLHNANVGNIPVVVLRVRSRWDIGDGIYPGD